MSKAPPKGHHDIFVTVIGRPEQPERVRAARLGVDVRQYFGASSCQSSCIHTTEYEERLMQTINEKVTERVMRMFQQ